MIRATKLFLAAAVAASPLAASAQTEDEVTQSLNEEQVAAPVVTPSPTPAPAPAVAPGGAVASAPIGVLPVAAAAGGLAILFAVGASMGGDNDGSTPSTPSTPRTN